MKKNFSKIITLSLLAISSFSACEKSSDDPEITPVAEAVYPVKITSLNSNPNAKLVTLYELKYGADKKLSSVSYFNGDSLYNTIVYDSKGQVTKIGTAKNPSAIVFEYDAAGKVSKTTETTYQGRVASTTVRNFEHDAQGRISKNIVSYSPGSSFTTSFTYDAKENITKAEYKSSASANTAARSYAYNDKLSPFAAKELTPLTYAGLHIYGGGVEFSSKNLVTENLSLTAGDGSYLFEYEYDNKNRVTKIIQKSKDTGKQTYEYVITY